MNPAKAIHNATPAEEIAPTGIKAIEPAPKPALTTMRGARLRQLLILSTALLAAWIAIVALSSIKEINTDLEEIHARFSLPTY
jgi:hypothetical protein